MFYLTSTTKSIGTLLAQEVKGQKRPMYYITCMLPGANERYSTMERHCLALVFVIQKLRHYLLAYPLHVITKCDPIRYLLTKSVLAGRATKWMLSLVEFDITCKTPSGLGLFVGSVPCRDFEPFESRNDKHVMELTKDE